MCDKEAEILRDEIEDKQGETNIKFVGKCAIKVHNTIVNGAIKEIIWKIDAIESEKEYIREKIEYNSEYVDVEARNAFSANLITSSIIKCASRYN